MQATPQQPKTTERWITAIELSQKLGVGKSSTYAWLRAGILPPGVRLSRRCVRWPESVIDEWMRQRAKLEGFE